MKVILNYKVKAGSNYSDDDVFEWVVDSPNKELEEAFTRAVMTGTYLEDVPEFQALCESEKSKIEEHVLQDLAKDGEDYTVLEALGEVRMDADELNNLVHSKDSYAIKFFGLESMTEDQLQTWNSSELETIPLVKDFQKDFKPINPFNSNYKLEVFVPDVDEVIPTEDEVIDYIRKAFISKDVALAEEVILEHNSNYEDLIEKSFEIAEEVGCQEFIDKNKA